HNITLEHDNIPWITPLLGRARSRIVLPRLQAHILNVICMLHKSDEPSRRRAFLERYHLVEAYNALDMHSYEAIIEPADGSNEALGRQNWLKRQNNIRSGMMIWVSS